MKEDVVRVLSRYTKLDTKTIEESIEIPPSVEFGDYSFPCFSLSKLEKKNPAEIAKQLANKIEDKGFEKVEAKGPYLNFFINRVLLAEITLKEILKKKDNYGSSNIGSKKTIVIDMSSPNIAKPFGIGHLRSTIIGNSLAEISGFLGFKPIKINYLGDWGTQFGKLIVGWKKAGNKEKLKKNPIAHMLELYILGNKEEYEENGREWFKKLENNNKEAIDLWKLFRKYGLEDFERIYSILGIKFDEISGESYYRNSKEIIFMLEKKNLLVESDDATIIDLEKYNFGKALIKKSDGTTLYATRDIAAAIDRYKKYKFARMFYETGQEQILHFRQIFKILDLLGLKWAKDCVHITHGLYLDNEGKKLATRKGTTIFLNDILTETISLAKSEIKKREKLQEKELEKRAKAIAIAAIFYGDLKNNRTSNIVFDIQRFLSFEGDTGPYLLYSYARAKSILKNAKSKKLVINQLNDAEKHLISDLSNFPNIVLKAYEDLSPNIVANYAFKLSQTFNEFYHSNKVIGDKNENFRLALVESFSIVLKSALSLLGISVLEKM